MISFLVFVAGVASAKPLFSDVQIDQFVLDLKKQNKIPERALDLVFDFYKHNRAAVGGLKETSCLQQKGYKIRWQDNPMKLEDLKSGIENETCLCVIDYTRPKTDERGHCIFLEPHQPPRVESFLTAHGEGSKEQNGKPLLYTNSLRPTGTTLSGLFLTAKQTYKFQGEKKGQYTSMGLGLYGVEKSNWTAAPVGKVTHGAPYVVDDPEKKKVENSLGCPAMPMKTAEKLLPLCRGKAAWLNYTDEVKNSSALKPQACSFSPAGA